MNVNYFMECVPRMVTYKAVNIYWRITSSKWKKKQERDREVKEREGERDIERESVCERERESV